MDSADLAGGMGEGDRHLLGLPDWKLSSVTPENAKDAVVSVCLLPPTVLNLWAHCPCPPPPSTHLLWDVLWLSAAQPAFVFTAL